MSYWDLQEINAFLSSLKTNNAQVLNFIEENDCYLVLSNTLHNISSESGGLNTGVNLAGMSRQPNEGLIAGSIEPEKIIGVIVNINGDEIFQDNMFGDEPKPNLAGHRTINYILARRILLQSALKAIPVYDINGNLIWPKKEKYNDTSKPEALSLEKLMSFPLGK